MSSPYGLPPAPHARPRRGSLGWLRELLLGARMALAGGASGWVRTALTSLGVGLGVAMLLTAASVPNAMAARDGRQAARAYPVFISESIPASETTVVVREIITRWRGVSVRGVMLQPDGARPPLPPGLTEVPGPGEMVASPALARLLADPDGALLRERLDYPVVATIGVDGIAGPGELLFYLGATDLDESADMTVRIGAFGEEPSSSGLDPILGLIVVVIFVVLLVPVGLFVAAAIRFGGEARDRRLAGVRLLGADARMAHRIAAGEALVGSLLGLVVGVALFTAGRSQVSRFELFGVSAFPADVRPDGMLTLAIAVAVPAVAVLLTLVSMRRVVIEPLGITRRSGDTRRRLWWRLLLPLLGVAVLYPLFGSLTHVSGDVETRQAAAGIILILVGVAALLPWAVQAAVRRLRGGPVPWQLAVRRLQLDSGTSARAVMGIAVAVAGAVGLQTLFSSVEGSYVTSTGMDPSRADLFTSVRISQGWDQIEAVRDVLLMSPGVDAVHSRASVQLTYGFDGGVPPQMMVPATPPNASDPCAGEFADRCTFDGWSQLTIGDCETLRLLAAVDACVEGDVFLVAGSLDGSPAEPGVSPASDLAPLPQPGEEVALGDAFGPLPVVPWTVPTTSVTVGSRYDPGGSIIFGVLATPSAVPVELLGPHLQWTDSFVTVDHLDPDAVEQLRNTLWSVDPGAQVGTLVARREASEFATIRRGLLVGVTLTLILIGVSLLVTVLEQLRDRRRVLAGLVAFGTRRRTLAWSIVWQTVIPVALGMVLAIGAGVGVGAALLTIASQPVRVDWPVVGLFSGVAALVVLAVTALSTPVLFRLMRADGLRSE